MAGRLNYRRLATNRASNACLRQHEVGAAGQTALQRTGSTDWAGQDAKLLRRFDQNPCFTTDLFDALSAYRIMFVSASLAVVPKRHRVPRLLEHRRALAAIS